MLFEVFAFKRIIFPECRPFWQIGVATYPTHELEKVSHAFSSILHEKMIPVSFIDLLLALKVTDRNILPSEEMIRFLLSANESVEVLPDDYYQVPFAKLKGAQRLAYRVLWEAKETPMHSDDIAKEINQRLVSMNRRSISKRSVVGGMIKEAEWFQTIGKSGMWGLAEWELVQGSIVSLMKECFHKLKKPAKATEIYNCVKHTREQVKPNSISAYLSDRPEFVRVGKGLFQPREWKITDEMRQELKQLKEPWNIERYSSVTVQIFEDWKVEEIPRADLAKELAKRSGRPLETIQGNVLKKLPVIQLQTTQGRRQKAILVKGYTFQRRITLRDKVHASVREILSQSPNQRLKLADLKIQVMRLTKCPEKTFYQYLTDMGEVNKYVLVDGSTIAQLQSKVSEIKETGLATGFNYDVAISYASQDVAYASELYQLLTTSGLKVFFAPQHQVRLSSDFIPDKLTSIYQDLSRKCVIFFSEHYSRSDYTNHERKAAYGRKMRENDYIFLIRLDGLWPFWWLEGDMYYEIKNMNLQQMADIIIKSLKT